MVGMRRLTMMMIDPLGKEPMRWTTAQHQWLSNICRWLCQPNICILVFSFCLLVLLSFFHFVFSSFCLFVYMSFYLFVFSSKPKLALFPGFEWYFEGAQQHSGPTHSKVNPQAWKLNNVHTMNMRKEK